MIDLMAIPQPVLDAARFAARRHHIHDWRECLADAYIAWAQGSRKPGMEASKGAHQLRGRRRVLVGGRQVYRLREVHADVFEDPASDPPREAPDVPTADMPGRLHAAAACVVREFGAGRLSRGRPRMPSPARAIRVGLGVSCSTATLILADLRAELLARAVW